MTSPRAAVLVPVKAFHDAKVRLAAALPEGERRRLARAMASTVLRAAGTLPTAVVCDDPEVAAWAVASRARVIDTPGLGLNGAVEAGVAALAADGYDRVVVAHADLPRAVDVSWPARFPGVTLVPDRREDGTNVLCIPARSGFAFSYGLGSFHRHRREAVRLGLALHVARRPELAWDVDVPDDLVALIRA